MTANESRIVTVELTGEELVYAIECAILAKYPHLDERNGWEWEDADIRDGAIHAANSQKVMGSFVYIKHDEDCGCAEWLGAPTSGCATCPKNCLKECR